MNYGPKQANVLIHFQWRHLDKLIICRSGCTIFAFECPGHIFRIPRSRCFVVFSVSTHLPRAHAHTHARAFWLLVSTARLLLLSRPLLLRWHLCFLSHSAFCGRRSIGRPKANERSERGEPIENGLALLFTSNSVQSNELANNNKKNP